MWHVATDVAWSVCLSLCVCQTVSSTTVSLTKTAEPIAVPLVIWTRVGTKNPVFGGGLDARPETKRQFGDAPLRCGLSSRFFDRLLHLWTRLRTPAEAEASTPRVRSTPQCRSVQPPNPGQSAAATFDSGCCTATSAETTCELPSEPTAPLASTSFCTSKVSVCSFGSGLSINFVSPTERAAQGAAEGGLMFCLCFLFILWRFLRLIISTSTGPIFTKYAELVELLL